jgi:DNA-binding MarR family transcriptional regulator
MFYKSLTYAPVPGVGYPKKEPYFSTTKGLSRQQQKIVDAIAAINEGTVRQIAEYCFITQQVAASQLKVLKDKSIVQSRKIESIDFKKTGRESFYSIIDSNLQDYINKRPNSSCN